MNICPNLNFEQRILQKKTHEKTIIQNPRMARLINPWENECLAGLKKRLIQAGLQSIWENSGAEPVAARIKPSPAQLRYWSYNLNVVRYCDSICDQYEIKPFFGGILYG